MKLTIENVEFITCYEMNEIDIKMEMKIRNYNTNNAKREII